MRRPRSVQDGGEKKQQHADPVVPRHHGILEQGERAEDKDAPQP
jgi:hypothetical protein